jgi:endo-1,4-beta-mannosidase
MQIDSFVLQNRGVFAARIQFKVQRARGPAGVFDEIETVDDDEWLAYGQDRYAYFGWDQYRIPEGSVVRLCAFVKGGRDVAASHLFVFRHYSQTASYELRGTTWNPTLRLLRVRPEK